MVKIIMACGKEYKRTIGKRKGRSQTIKNHVKRCTEVEGGCKEFKRLTYDISEVIE